MHLLFFKEQSLLINKQLQLHYHSLKSIALNTLGNALSNAACIIT